MKKLICLVIIMMLTVVLFGCGNYEENSNKNESVGDTGITEESTTEEITYKDITAMAREYLDNRISLENYNNTEDIEYDGDQRISFSPIEDKESSLSFTVNLEDGIPLTLFDTTTRNLLAQGFSKGNQVNAFNYEEDYGSTQDVYLLYDEKYLHVGEDRVSDQQVYFDTIREVALYTDKDAVEFEYCGLNANSTFEDVINCLGDPTGTTTIRYDGKTETCYIMLGYSDQRTDHDHSVWAYFHFKYDYTTDKTTLYQLFLNT